MADPFEILRAPTRSKGQSPFERMVSVFSGEQAPEARVGAARNIMLQELQQLTATGLSPGKAIRQLITSSPTFIEAFSADPDFSKNLLATIQAAQAPKGGSINVPAGTSVLETDPSGKINPEPVFTAAPAPAAVPADIQLVNAIIEADKAGDTKRAELLKGQLKSDNTGQTVASTALQLRAAGVTKTGNSFVDGISTTEARAAFEMGVKPPARQAPSINDLAVRATGNKSGNADVDKLTPKAAEAALRGRAEVLGAENFMAAFFGKIASSIPGQETAGQSVFERARGEAKKAKEGAQPEAAPQVPGVGAPEARATPEVTAPEEVPQNLTPAKIVGMSDADAVALSKRVEAGEVTLSREATLTLFGMLAAINARRGPTQ